MRQALTRLIPFLAAATLALGAFAQEPKEDPIKQLKLTEAQVKSFISAQPDLATVARSGCAEMKLLTWVSVSLSCLIGSSFGSCAAAPSASVAAARKGIKRVKACRMPISSSRFMYRLRGFAS
jgi:hypothetical protein